jgi:hypothetical protein
MDNTVVKYFKRIIPGLSIVVVLSLPALPSAWSAGSEATGSARGNATSQQAGEDRPDKGMSMHRVEQRYGKPLKILKPLGKPPITRWVYKNFTVYFEGRYVIHSVKNYLGEPPDEQPPAADQ